MEWKNVSAEGNSTGKGPEVGNSMVHLKQEDTNPEWMEQKERGDCGLESGALHLLPEGSAFFFFFFFTHSSTRGLRPPEQLERPAGIPSSDKTRPDSPVPTLHTFHQMQRSLKRPLQTAQYP